MSTELTTTRAPIAISPTLKDAGVTVVEQDGVRAVMIPQKLNETHNVVRPVSEIAQADPDWTPRLVEVYIDPTLDPVPAGKAPTSGKHVYVERESKKLSLRKEAILLLSDAAGIRVVASRTPSDELEEGEIGYDAVAYLRRSDGTEAAWPASKAIDIAMEREMVKASCVDSNGVFKEDWFRKRWYTERNNLRAKCESKAMLRAVSMALQLKRGGYTAEELRKPFLIVGWSMTPQDPEVRKQRLLQADQAAYGGRARQLAPAPEPEEAVDEPAPVEPTAQEPEVRVDESEVEVENPGADDEENYGEPAAVDAAEPVAGEIPPEVAKAGEYVIPFGNHKGRKIAEVAVDPKYPTQIEWLAQKYEPSDRVAGAHDELIAAARTWHAWAENQKGGAS